MNIFDQVVGGDAFVSDAHMNMDTNDGIRRRMAQISYGVKGHLGRMYSFRSILIGLLFLVATPIMAHAQFVSFNDYCSGIAPKLSVGKDITTATDTQLVPLIAQQAIYVCDCSVNQAAGAGTVYFESATAAACGGTLAQLSGSVTANTAVPDTNFHLAAGAGATALLVPTGKALCVHSTGTIQQGITCSYVQK